ncbi:TPR-like protein [Trametopsis cervina]|nr:TPR-like protein [Trametopsis cervina]
MLSRDSEEERWDYDETFENSEDSDDGSEYMTSEEESSEEGGPQNVTDTSAQGKGKGKAVGDVEPPIDRDFDRLVREIRGGDSAGAGALSKVWDFDMRDKEAEFKDDLREASGVGRKKGRRASRQKGVVLSQQVRALIGEGNQAYVDNDIPETLRIMQEVIRIEPRAGSAWSVLAQCYEDMKDGEKALQLRIMAAHLNQDPEEWDRLAQQSRQQGYHQQTLYCYRKLCQLDPSNVGAFWDRASLAKEVGELRTARHALLTILKRIPNDLSVLAELRPVLIELSDLDQCASLFQDAFNHYQEAFPSGQVPVTQLAPDGTAASFNLMEILVLADLYNTTGKYEKAVETIRRGCRWLQGRAAQKYWDSIEDDREWDTPVGPHDQSARIAGDGEIQPGMYPLDVNARHRLCISRIKMGDIAEGKMHASIVLSQDPVEYAPLFAEIADAYFDREMYNEAGHIYEMLGADPSTSSLQVLLQAAACRRMVGDLKGAAEVYEYVLKADPSNNGAKKDLASIYEILGETRKALDLLLQVIDARRRAKLTGRQGLEDDDGQPATSDRGVGASLFEEKARSGKEKVSKASGSKAGKLSSAQLRDLEAQKEKLASQSFRRVKDLWAPMLSGQEEAVREWMHEAELLVESFRETRALFLSARHMGFRGMFPRAARKTQNTSAEASEESMASRLQLELGRDSMAKKAKTDGTRVLDSFRTISFTDWLRTFMQYAFNLTKREQYDDALDVLRHILYSNAFQSRAHQDSIRCAIISCSIAANRYDVVVEQSRKLVNTHQFNNEPLRILLASLGSGLRPTDAFLASTLSKHMLREVRANDTALKNPESLRWNPVLKRYGVGAKVEEDDDDQDALEMGPSGSKEIGEAPGGGPKPRPPTKENPNGVALYGQICLAAKSYQSALFYLLHAYDYCKHDPLICLCLAIASVGRAMQRQADNRQHLIAQGLAFLTRYRELRGEDAPEEVEYNFGRVFHQLGLLTLAVRHYERVLNQTEQRLAANPEIDCGLASETAYNLSLIYMTTGATPLAQELYRRWLSI